MATRYAVASGNWSDPATWNGGTLPGPGDEVRSNTFTVTVDQDVAVLYIRNNAGGGAVAGGGFIIDSIPPEGRTLDCAVGTGATTCLTVSATSGVLNVLGGVGGGSGNPAHGIQINGNITLNAMSTVGGGSGAFGYGVYASVAATINIAILNASSNTGTGGLGLAQGGVVTLGDLIQNGSGRCVLCGASDSSTITVTGSVTVPAGSNVPCISLGSSATSLTILGPVTAGAGIGPVIAFASTTPPIDLQGALTATNTSHVLNGTGGAMIRVSGPLVSAPNGRLPLLVPGFTIPDTDAPFSMEVRDDLGQPVTLTNIVAASPPPGDVRSGVVYGIDNTLTGTLAVPDAGAVSYGTPVDDTTGTAALDLPTVAETLGQRIATTIGG